MFLAQIDPAPFAIEVRQKEALLARAEARVQSVDVDERRQQELIAINREKLRLARAEWDRLADLLRRDLIARQDLERMELAVRRIEEELARSESGLREAQAQRAVVRADQAAAAADLDRARKALGDTEVRAPFAGVIAEKLVALGEQVAPGRVLFRLADVGVVKVLVRVAADDVELLHPGVVATIRVRGFPEPFPGQVAHIGPQADTETRTYPVEILVTNRGTPGLRPGMFARASITVATYPAAILVPRASVVGEPAEPAVFVAEPDRGLAHRRPVTIARTLGSRHLIARGLAAGDLLIVAGQHLLRDGSRIRVVETRSLEP
jgi:RND family efflux transporter MFP subunit